IAGDERTTYRVHAFAPTLYIDTLQRESVHPGIATTAAALAPAVRISEFCVDGQDPETPAGCSAVALDRGLPTAQRIWNDHPGAWITSHTSYDAFGNVDTVNDPNGQSTTTDYDTRFHVYPVRITNALDQHADSSWNFVLGKRLAKYDWTSDPWTLG